MRTVLTNAALELTISRERLEKYLNATHQDLDAALKLYEENTRISEAFYGPLQCLEICLRNSIYIQMSNVYGPDWLSNGLPPLTSDSKQMIFDATEELRRRNHSATPGRLVAEIKFGFWVGLLGQKYDATLWRKALFRAFLAKGGKPRSLIHRRFNTLRLFRNRVAHHEPIFHRQLIQIHDEIIEAIGWMCRETAAWAHHHSRFNEVSTHVSGK